MALPSWTSAQVLAQLDSGLKWTAATITYSFPQSSSGVYSDDGEAAGFRPFDTPEFDAARRALQMWDDLIAPDMMEVTPGNSWWSSDIEFAFSSTNVAYAHAYFPQAGTVWLNAGETSGDNNLSAPTPGSHGFFTYIHEIGHALGLEHMGEYEGAHATTPSSFQDSTVVSIMSYYGPNWGSGVANGEGLVAWADWVGADGQTYAPQTPMVNDIMAAQAMYGVETGTRTGNTVYGFNSNVTGSAAAIFNFGVNENPILTIFDSAGIDTLDFSGYDTPSVINLAPGGASSANHMTNNIWIAASSLIENASGGSGDDFIYGNTGANILYGNAGNDSIFGGSGSDVLFGNAGNDFLSASTGRDVYYGGAGRDIFEFRSSLSSTNLDTIADFSRVDDTIYLENAIFRKLTKTGTLSSKFFAVGTAARDSNDFILYNRKTGFLSYDSDGNGRKAPVKFAYIDPDGLSGSVASSDFVII